MRPVKMLSVATLVVAATSLAAAPPADRGGGKGGGKGGDDPDASVELPTNVFIVSDKLGLALYVAGADASQRQKIYDFANSSANLHDAVLVEDGHGRALVTDRSSDLLPYILVDFWFDPTGKITSSQSRWLIDRPDWGCEALSSDGTRAIFSAAGSGVVHEIDLDTGAIFTLWSFDPSLFLAGCDFRSDDNSNGVLHAVVLDPSTGVYRIDRRNIAAQSTATVLNPQQDGIRDFAIHYAGNDIVTVAIGQASGVRIGTSFADAAGNSIAIEDGYVPDFYCDGERVLSGGPNKRKRATYNYTITTGNLTLYENSFKRQPQTLC